MGEPGPDGSRCEADMKASQVELLAIAAVDAIRSGRRVEDDRIELKRQWPEPKAKARQLAAAANGANGQHLSDIARSWSARSVGVNQL